MLVIDNDSYVLVCDHLTDAQLLHPKDIPTQYNMQFINHACEPNCVLEIWRDINGWFRAVIIAVEDIYNFMELSFHYRWEVSSSSPRTPCNCGLKEPHFIEAVVDRPSVSMIQPVHTPNRVCSQPLLAESHHLSQSLPPTVSELTVIK
jgi:hypothetical protein